MEYTLRGAGNHYVIYGLESRKRCWNDMICASTKGMATTETFFHLLNQKYMQYIKSDAIKMLERQWFRIRNFEAKNNFLKHGW